MNDFGLRTTIIDGFYFNAHCFRSVVVGHTLTSLYFIPLDILLYKCIFNGPIFKNTAQFKLLLSYLLLSEVPYLA
jgi:hypothetical protein